jgi:hypothetical protein
MKLFMKHINRFIETLINDESIYNFYNQLILLKLVIILDIGTLIAMDKSHKSPY